MILGLSRLKQVSAEGIVLAGVAISSMLGGATTLIQYFANEIQLASLVFWTFGDLGSTGWSDLRVMSGMVLVLLAYCVSHRWDYNALLSGEETAVSLGIHVQRLTLTNMVLCCLTCSIIVSRVGLINFIGWWLPILSGWWWATTTYTSFPAPFLPARSCFCWETSLPGWQ